MNRISRIGLLAIFLAALGSAKIGAQTSANVGLMDFVSKRLSTTSTNGSGESSDKDKISKFCAVSDDAFARRVFIEYGAVFAATDKVQIPQTCIFLDDAAVRAFQSQLRSKSAPIDDVAIDLQEAAMDALVSAVEEASLAGIKVSPFDGAIAARRSYTDSVRIWSSRFQPALDHWVRMGRITPDEAVAVRQMPTSKQVQKVMEWEATGLWFNTTRTGSIFTSTAPPGTSQHLTMLAFDVRGPIAPGLRTIFNNHGWYQTVRDDPQHLTYLGVREAELPARGLRPLTINGTSYWVPYVPEATAAATQSN